MTIDKFLQEHGPFSYQELVLLERLLSFVRDRNIKKQSGRIEFHADNSGVVKKCPVFLNDEV